jgi:uncharacterized protein YbjQ (UPF0145 family)
VLVRHSGSSFPPRAETYHRAILTIVGPCFIWLHVRVPPDLAIKRNARTLETLMTVCSNGSRVAFMGEEALRALDIARKELGFMLTRESDKVKVEMVFPASRAKMAGLEVSDVVTAVNGNMVATIQDFAVAIDEVDLSDSFTIGLSRLGEELVLELPSIASIRQKLAQNLVTEESSNGGSSVNSATVPNRILIATSNELPGYEAYKYHGDVMGITVITSNVFANFGANMKKYVGGEVGAYVKMLTDGRGIALSRMRVEAERLGANAVIAMRLDANQISDVMTELIAYGTAVSIRQMDES